MELQIKSKVAPPEGARLEELTKKEEEKIMKELEKEMIITFEKEMEKTEEKKAAIRKEEGQKLKLPVKSSGPIQHHSEQQIAASHF